VRKGFALFVAAVILASAGCGTARKSPGGALSAPEAVVYHASIEECTRAVEETLRGLGDEFTRGEDGFLTEKRERDGLKDMEIRLATYGTFVRKSIRLLPVEGGATEVRVEVEVYKKDYLLNADTREDDPGLASEVRGEFFEALGRRLSPGEKPRRMRQEEPLSI
jgi:hypothetical protein